MICNNCSSSLSGDGRLKSKVATSAVSGVTGSIFGSSASIVTASNLVPPDGINGMLIGGIIGLILGVFISSTIVRCPSCGGIQTY